MSGDRPAENPAPAPVRFALAPIVNQCIFARKEDAQIQHSPNYRNRRKQMRGSRRVLATMVHINLALIVCAMLVTGRVTVQRSVGISAQSMNLMDSRGKKGQVCETEASPDRLTLVLSFLKRCVPQIAGGEQIKTDHNMRKREERRLTGPGSSPPSCKSKCGRCVPCKPVHVPIQPGRKRTFEYYPEAWRCKCGNKLYMP